MFEVRKPLAPILAAAMLATVTLTGCAVEQTQEGELPEVEVEGGQMPEYEVETGEVTVDTEEKTVEVPDVDVDVSTEEETVEVPDVEVTMPDDPEEGGSDGSGS